MTITASDTAVPMLPLLHCCAQSVREQVDLDGAEGDRALCAYCSSVLRRQDGAWRREG